MSDGIHHITHAQHNLDFLQNFYGQFKYNDWSITVAFYACVHIVENALFQTKTITYQGKRINIEHSEEFPDKVIAAGLTLPRNWNPSTHNSRFLIIWDNFPQIESPYRALFNASQNARYISYKWKNPHVKKYVEQQLPKIIQWSNSNGHFKSTLTVQLIKPSLSPATPAVES